MGHYGDLAAIAQAGGAPSVLALDTGFFTFMPSEDGWIYGTDLTDLWRVPLGGGDKELVAHAGLCYHGAVTPGAAWCAFGQGLTRVDLQTGAATQLGSSAGYIAESLAVDDTRAYWTAGGALLAVDHAGGPTRVLLSSSAGELPWPRFVAADAAAIYVATDQAIVRIDKARGGVATLRAGSVSALVVRKGMVFWSDHNAGRIGATPANGGSDLTIAEGEAGVIQLAASDRGLFWFSKQALSADRQALRAAYFAP
jgi:hypothetical protein